MNVLYFHQHFTTPKGATGTRSYEMARRLIAHGHEVTMVCGRTSRGTSGLEREYVRGRRNGIVDGIHVIELHLPYSNTDGFLRRSWLFLLFALRSIRIALGREYDVLFATTTPLTTGIPGIFARWLRGKPFVFEVRDLWPELPREMEVITNPLVLWLLSLLEWCSYWSAHRLVGLSPGIVQGIQRRGVSAERITLIPNGCDLRVFSDERGAWRPEDVAPSDLVAVFAGAHGIANGLGAALDAAMELKVRGRTDVKLVLIGDGRLKPRLQGRARNEGLDNVIFLDSVQKQKLAGLLQGANLGMQLLANVPAFYYGTSPNKFFDYIAAGLPVLINYPGWLADMIKESECGFVVPPDDPGAFADALEEAADHRETLTKMGVAASGLARERFDRDRLGEQFVEWVTSSRDPE